MVSSVYIGISPFYEDLGAADRIRTGTGSHPADFKSAVSTIPPQRRGLPNHFSIVFGGSQGVPMRPMADVGVGVPDDPVMRSIT